MDNILIDKINKDDKFIFLDFDGVITTPFTDWKLSNHHIGIIKFILDITKAKIIISSSWRHRDIHNTIKSLGEVGYYKPFPFPLVDYVVGQIDGNDIYERLHSRGKYIQDVVDTLKIPLDNYIILDDNDSNISYLHKESFIQTNPSEGITVDNAVKCIQLLHDNTYSKNDLLMSFVM